MGPAGVDEHHAEERAPAAVLQRGGRQAIELRRAQPAAQGALPQVRAQDQQHHHDRRPGRVEDRLSQRSRHIVLQGCLLSARPWPGMSALGRPRSMAAAPIKSLESLIRKGLGMEQSSRHGTCIRTVSTSRLNQFETCCEVSDTRFVGCGYRAEVASLIEEPVWSPS